MERSVYIPAVLCCLLLPAFASAQVLPFTQYTPDNDLNPLPSAEVHQVYQDRQGYIWMVVYSSGLVRYDGATMDLYTTDDGLRDLGLWSVLEDSLGRLWVASNAGLVVSEKPLGDYAGDRIRFTSSPGSTELLNVAVSQNRIAIDRQGRLWVGTESAGIVRYRADDLRDVAADTIRTALDGQGPSLTVRALTVRRDGSVWVGLGGGELLVFDQDAAHFDVIPPQESIPDQNTRVLYESPAGVLWGGTNRGQLWRLEEAGGRRSIVPVGEALETDIVSLLATSDSTLWVASGGAGLLKVDPADETKKTLYTRRNGLLSEKLHHLMQDREGNLWFAQAGGVSKLRFDYTAFEQLTANSYTGERPILPGPSVNAVALAGPAGPGCSIWAGTSEGLACIGRGGTSEYIQVEQGLRDASVTALAFDRAGRLWIGTYSGINVLARPANPPPPAPQRQVLTLLGEKMELAGYRHTSIVSISRLPMHVGEAEGRTLESLWFPGYKSLYLLAEDAWFIFRTSSGLPSTWFQTVAFDDAGRLWVGTRDHGLYRSVEPLSLASLRRMEKTEVPFVDESREGTFGSEIVAPVFEPVWSTSFGAPTNQIEALRWRDGVMWVGTPEGLMALEGEPVRMAAHLTQHEGLKANNVVSMAFSPVNGSLWIGTNGGLAEIDPVARRVVRTITKQDGLLDNEVWYNGSVVVGEEGTVYFGTAKGLAVYRPQEDRVNRVEPLLQVKRAVYSEDESGNNEIAITYAGLSFASEKQVRYKTRLLGYDTDWSPEITDVKIRYTNLPAHFTRKKYTLEVLARNEDGLWTAEPLTYSFYVQPAWWSRWWAFVLYAVLLAAGVFVVDRVQRARLIRKERQQAQIREARLKAEAAEAQAKALQAENERKELELRKAHELEQAYHHLKTTQAQLIQQEKMASLGQLTAGIAHEIKNPLNFVNNFAELNAELSQELIQDLEASPGMRLSEIRALLVDLKNNAEKIYEHGKRADAIVRNMMQHAVGATGERSLTDVNALLDEFVGLAYHGMRAQQTDFYCVIEQDYDGALGEVVLMPQEMGRVFLNLLNNAFYAVHERARSADGQYIPTVSVRTRREGDRVEIRIRDNGQGIPEAVRRRIFEPFFTTKPTGTGTGLGLSLSYDIVTHGHGGTLEVESKEGEGATFVIVLPSDSPP